MHDNPFEIPEIITILLAQEQRIREREQVIRVLSILLMILVVLVAILFGMVMVPGRGHIPG